MTDLSPDDTLPLSPPPVPAARGGFVAAALGRADGGALGRFLAAADPGEGLKTWFGETLWEILSRDRDALIAAVNRDIAEIDDLLSEQVDAILRRRRFQTLEASWRGLKYLVDQSAPHDDVIVRVLTSSWREVCRDFERAVEFDQSQLFHKVYSEEFGMPGGRPFGVLLCDYAVAHRPAPGRETDDVAGLRHLAQVAAAAFCPALIGADPALFGLETFHELCLPQNLQAVFQQDEYLRWRRLRELEDARFIGVTAPRVLMRGPYGDTPAARYGFRYREDADGMELADYCWGNAVYAYGSVLIRAFAMSGWFADIRGSRRDEAGGGRVEGLPIPDFATDAPGAARKFAVEAVMSAHLEKELDDLGFVPVSRCKDTPYLAFYGNQSVQLVKSYNQPAAAANAKLSAMLRYMFCIGRFAHYIKVQVRDRIGAHQTAEHCEQMLNEWLMGYALGNDDASIDQKARYPLREASVQVREVPGKPGSFACVIYLKPHFQLDQVFSSFKLVTELNNAPSA
jgi:type VI secretion system protein ImpD